MDQNVSPKHRLLAPCRLCPQRLRVQHKEGIRTKWSGGRPRACSSWRTQSRLSSCSSESRAEGSRLWGLGEPPRNQFLVMVFQSSFQTNKHTDLSFMAIGHSQHYLPKFPPGKRFRHSAVPCNVLWKSKEMYSEALFFYKWKLCDVSTLLSTFWEHFLNC